MVMDRGKLVMEGTPAEVFSRGDELKSIGLALPSSMEIVSQLRERGLDIEGECLSMDDAADRIAEVLKSMIRDITLGQFYPTESWVHRLDPRIKK